MIHFTSIFLCEVLALFGHTVGQFEIISVSEAKVSKYKTTGWKQCQWESREADKIYRCPAVQKGARAPTLLHVFLSLVVVSDVIR